MSDRAVVPVVGVVLLLLITVVLAAAVGSAALSSVPDAHSSAAPTAALALSVSGDRLSLDHRGGSALDVQRLDLRVSINDTPLTHQPPVPFFSADGFRPGPTGPFNSASDGSWRVGETASFRLASTNSPSLGSDARITVRVLYRKRLLARLSATA